jgi:hypothetical protein
MDIIVTISDSQWQEFQESAKEAVEATLNGSYEDFAIYIMVTNIKRYIESQQKKREKQIKRALADYEEMLKKEQDISTTQLPDTKPESTLTVLVEKPPEKKKEHTFLTNRERSERMKELRDIAPDKRTPAEIDELHTLLTRRKDKYKKKQQRRQGNHI